MKAKVFVLMLAFSLCACQAPTSQSYLEVTREVAVTVQITEIVERTVERQITVPVTVERPVDRQVTVPVTVIVEKEVVITATPTPSKTPLPTASPPSSPSTKVEFDIYILAARPLALSYVDSLKDVTALMGAVSEDLPLMFDEEWRSKVGAALAIWKTTGLKVRALEPPPECQEAHAHFVEGTLHFDRAADLLCEGIDEFNPDKIAASDTELTLGAQALKRSTVELLKLSE